MTRSRRETRYAIANQVQALSKGLADFLDATSSMHDILPLLTGADCVLLTEYGEWCMGTPYRKYAIFQSEQGVVTGHTHMVDVNNTVSSA